MPTVPCKIAGVFNCPLGKDVMKKLKAGDALQLIREPQNPYGKNAIAVYASEPPVVNPETGEVTNSTKEPVKVGYVPKEIAAKYHNTAITATLDGNFATMNIEAP